VEDADYSPVKALQKISPSNEEQSPLFAKSIEGFTKISPTTDIQPTASTRGCYTVNASPTTMYVSNIPYNPSKQVISNVLSFNKPSGASHVLATSHQFIATTYSATGTFELDFIRIQCGPYYGDFTPLSNINIYTEAFGNTRDVYADEECLMAFVGRCIGTATGGGPCSFSTYPWKLTVCW